MNLSDEEIIRRCLKKDAKAQRALYDRYSPLMFGLCIRYARCRQDAEDIFQEAFIKAFSQLDKYSFKGAFGGWLRHLFVNCALNYYRYDKSHFFCDVQDCPSLVEKPVQLDNFSTAEILDMVASLPENCKMVFNLIEIEGYSYKELSEMLQLSESTLRGLNFKAKQLLREKINKKNIQTGIRNAD